MILVAFAEEEHQVVHAQFVAELLQARHLGAQVLAAGIRVAAHHGQVMRHLALHALLAHQRHRADAAYPAP